MKWNGTSRSLKALGISLAVGLGMTACSRDYTVAYVYVTTSKTALVNAYAVDYQSGAIQQLSDSPIPASDTTNANPVALVAAPNGRSLYVVNHDVSQVVQFAVGTDGKLYAQQTTSVVKNAASTIIGSFPTAAAIDPSGNFLFVTFTFQNGFTTAFPGPGGIAVFPIQHSSNSAQEGLLGAAVVNTTVGGATTANPLPYFPVGNNPTGIFVNPIETGTAGHVYVIDQDHTAAGVAQGVLLAFNLNYAVGSGQLTPIAGPTLGGYSAGTTPAGIVVEQTGRFIYVTDSATNQLYGYSLTSANVPQTLTTGPFTTGQVPLGITVEPRGMFVYVANFGSGTVSEFTIDQANGALSGGGGSAAEAGTACVTVEPAVGLYLFAPNTRDNTVTALQLDPHTGMLSNVQNTPFSTAALPTCAVSIANGAHATSVVN